MRKLPPHIVLEDKREVWFVGSYQLSLGMKSIVNQYYPGYKGCLASKDYFNTIAGLDISVLD